MIDQTENNGKLGRRGKTGETGFRGPMGHRGTPGPPGLIGKRGAAGKQGRKGLRGLEGLEGLRGPDHKDDVLDDIVRHFQDVYEQLATLMKRTAQVERQLQLPAAIRARGAKR